MQTKTIDDLNKLFKEAEQVDTELLAEQRSNILLYAGEHYSKKGSKFFNRIRDARDIAQEQKLRITKNHTQRICKTYVNNILTYAPGVTAYPHNDTELQSIKAAELNKAVMRDADRRYKLRSFFRRGCEQYIRVGEVFSLITWNPDLGTLVGYEQALDENGEPQVEEDGSPKAGEKAIFSGDFEFKHFLACNVLRDPGSKDINKSPFLVFREMAYVDDLTARLGDDEEKKKLVQESKDETYIVFDSATSSYSKAEGQCLLRYFFFRPSIHYPQGYFYIATMQGILWEGELPFGIWPIASAGFDDIEDSARSRGIIKVIRPYQAEINRASSKVAETQITLGDDKLVLSGGSKLTNGATMPGIRSYHATGAAPTILPGRSGDQYIQYIQTQITEMYQAAMVEEDLAEKQEAQLDPYMALYKSMKQKKKFVVPADKFAQYMIDVYSIFLKLAKHYYDEDRFIMAAGKSERINLAEFKNLSEEACTLELEEQSEDVESKLGRQLALNHLVQYVGPQLGKDDIGKIIRNMPFANVEDTFSDLTLDYDCVTNDILALDRGEQPPVSGNENHAYYIKKIENRMKKPDFRYLSPEIQQNYQLFKQVHEKFFAEQTQQAQMATSGFVPVGGALVACDMYVNDPVNPEKAPKRVRVPYQALDWLLGKLNAQGMSLQALEQMQLAPKAEVEQMMNNNPAPQGQGEQNGRNNEPRNNGNANNFVGGAGVQSVQNNPTNPTQRRPIGGGQVSGQIGGPSQNPGPGYR